MRGWRLIAATASWCLASGTLAAQSGDGAEPRGSSGDSASLQRSRGARWGSGAWLPRLRLDNDAYNFWVHPAHRTDEQYSNGVVASLETLRAPWWGARVARGTPGCGEDLRTTGACLTTQLSIAQSIYTPNLNRAPYSYPGWESERPYAAALTLGARGRIVRPRTLRQVDVALGITGPPALGQTAQNIAHWINSRYTTEAHGWGTQVGVVPGVQIGWRQSLLAVRLASGPGGWFDLAPAAGVTLGTIRSSADVGARARLGFNVAHPWDPRAWRGRAPLEFHTVAAVRAEYVARDFSLDGTLVDPERRVERVAGVREYEVGASLRMHRLRLEWSATTRTREFTTGPARHVFSTMSATWEVIP